MHFFGLLGVIMFVIGFGFASYLGIDKLFINPSGRLIAERTEFFIALSTMIIGSQFFVAGFLGEIILQSQKNKERYHITNTTKQYLQNLKQRKAKQPTSRDSELASQIGYS